MSKIAVPALLILIGLVGLITMGILHGSIPEVHVGALLDGDYHGQEIKVQGVIRAIEKDTRPMRFEVRDFSDETRVLVAVVDDHRPDIFKTDTDVAVVGTYDRERGVFEGTRIYTKCPSKYESSAELGATGSQNPGPAAVPLEDGPADPGS